MEGEEEKGSVVCCWVMKDMSHEIELCIARAREVMLYRLGAVVGRAFGGDGAYRDIASSPWVFWVGLSRYLYFGHLSLLFGSSLFSSLPFSVALCWMHPRGLG